MTVVKSFINLSMKWQKFRAKFSPENLETFPYVMVVINLSGLLLLKWIQYIIFKIHFSSLVYSYFYFLDSMRQKISAQVRVVNTWSLIMVLIIFPLMKNGDVLMKTTVEKQSKDAELTPTGKSKLIAIKINSGYFW